MRVVLVSLAERTNFLNLVPLGWALRAAGHDVLVASQPALGPLARASGLPYASVGRDHAFWRHLKAVSSFDAVRGGVPLFADFEEGFGGRPWDEVRDSYRQVVTWWWRMVNDPMTDDLVDLCLAWRPDLVVWEAVTHSGAVAAEACGARHIRYPWGSDLFGVVRETFLSRWAEQPEDEREDPLAAWLSRTAARHGVEFSEALVTGHATVEQIPSDLRLPTPEHIHYLPVRYVPYNGRAVVPDWLRTPPDRPRIGLCLGSSTAEWLGRFGMDTRAVLEGLADLDAEVVATLPDAERERLGTVPPNTRLVDYVPLHALAPTCAAMITHGGTGTVLSGLAHGVPQVISPRPTYDEALVARTVAQRGAAIALDPETVTSGVMARTMRTLLGDARFTYAARALGQQVADMPSPAELAGRLADDDW
ncbi:nucleotide disphospho-sugar-binding domain-containing protein [Nocardiopsis deserti]|uniref:nucleotide disphospho-sugar-binding domain-containing protein n=1 Tax=Nocardiopsis deserti TaxID=2605988 RepID=UPI00123B1C79|nr:nucleotide disphospho-sugar-binding domain-containing protein [Nocardiopsis deserti]